MLPGMKQMYRSLKTISGLGFRVYGLGLGIGFKDWGIWGCGLGFWVWVWGCI